VTLINRHYEQSASVRVRAAASRVLRAELLAGDSAHAANSAQQPEHVKLAPLAVHADGPGVWRVELPAHSMATVELA
jgi:alpha-L-arabinofuranosidase